MILLVPMIVLGFALFAALMRSGHGLKDRLMGPDPLG